MELISFGKELLQTGTEYVASFRSGQVVLRQADRVLWTLEKTARWAVPPPLEADDRQPELVRPVGWAVFLWLLVTLRVTREALSLLNLLRGKPPLRSADVVMYIQSKRRYLRTLKYQGSKMMRARSSAAGQRRRDAWYSKLRTMFQLTMCFSRPADRLAADRPTDEEVLVMKRKRARSPQPAETENAMERLIEKMMGDLDADSEDDSSYTLTNATSVKSDSDITESEHDAHSSLEYSPHSSPHSPHSSTHSPQSPDPHTSTPNKSEEELTAEDTDKVTSDKKAAQAAVAENNDAADRNGTCKVEKNGNDSNAVDLNSSEAKEAIEEVIDMSPKKSSKSFIKNETLPNQRTQKKQRLANGRTTEGSQSKKKGIVHETSWEHLE